MIALTRATSSDGACLGSTLFMPLTPSKEGNPVMTSDRSQFEPPQIQATERTIAVEGGELIYCEAGPANAASVGVPLVLIHGWSSNRDSLAAAVRFL